jgi:hypothetical protein
MVPARPSRHHGTNHQRHRHAGHQRHDDELRGIALPELQV